MEPESQPAREPGGHVAILSTPRMGHLIPLIELAKKLVHSHHFTVTFIIPTKSGSRLRGGSAREDEPAGRGGREGGVLEVTGQTTTWVRAVRVFWERGYCGWSGGRATRRRASTSRYTARTMLSSTSPGRLPRADQGQGIHPPIMGAAGPGAGPPGHRWLPVSLRLELHPRERRQRSADDRVAALRGTENERRAAGGGNTGGAAAEGQRGRGGRQGGGGGGGEGADGRGRREEYEEPNEGTERSGL
ncbi:hypothetical protein SAY86_001516 [Trapa natans]|uniref:Uncharacterized protein n=1 Tax=Trapa natans TaxID=22666 RepID=A0AAN7RNZ4_TRANT|nr:hypothetical protein SAY86_001516 [Trapa natans]